MPAGVKLAIDDPAREDFGAHRREVGLLLGDYGGANVVTLYGAYAFNAHLVGRARAGAHARQFLGRPDTRRSA